MGLISNTTNEFQSCIDACAKCSQSCFECFNACLGEPDLNARNICISTLVECAIMCHDSVAMMARNGIFSKDHCKLCAKICEKCAKECSVFEDTHCKKCAEVCTMCAEKCKKMTAM